MYTIYTIYIYVCEYIYIAGVRRVLIYYLKMKQTLSDRINFKIMLPKHIIQGKPENPMHLNHRENDLILSQSTYFSTKTKIPINFKLPKLLWIQTLLQTVFQTCQKFPIKAALFASISRTVCYD